MASEHKKALKELIRQHIAAWNNTDETSRKAAIATLYHAEAKLADPEGKYKGHEELNTAIAAFQAKFPGAIITLHDKIDIHHNGAYYTWELGVPDNPPLATGTDFVLLKDDLIKTLYVFIDK